MPLTGQSVSRTASFSRDFRAIQRASCLTYTEAWPGLTFFLARDEIAIDARDNAPHRTAAAYRPVKRGLLQATATNATIFLVHRARSVGPPPLRILTAFT